MDNSQMFQLNLKDLANGAIMTIGAAVLGAIQQGIVAHGFDFASYDWNQIANIAVIALITYLSKKYFSTSDGKVFGTI